MLEELKYLRRRNEELSYNDKECQANKAKINQLEGELNTLKDQTSALHAQNIKLKQDSEAARNQPPGQLPDLDPGKVSIIQPALNGTNGIIESPFFSIIILLVLSHCSALVKTEIIYPKNVRTKVPMAFT